jgi:hypothetical protein
MRLRKHGGRQQVGLLALVAAMAFIVSACGPDSSSHGKSTVPPPVPVPPASPTATPTPSPAVAAACVASGAMGILVNSATGNVTVYAPAGDWSNVLVTGVLVVPVEGSGVSAAKISTPNVVNSCSGNSATGTVICSANNSDVYLLNGSTLSKTVTSSGSGTTSFSGGSCTNCNAIADPVTNSGIIGLSLTGGAAGYQFFNLSSGAAGTTTNAPSGVLSESPAIEPNKHWILSATESNDYQIIQFDLASGVPQLFQYANRASVITAGELDGAAIDCTTDIAAASVEFTNDIFLADLKQAVFTPGSGGSPGTWTAPAQLQPLAGLVGITSTGLSIAPSGHVGIMQAEFGGNDFAVFSLPSTSGSGTPAVSDWVAATVPNTPSGAWNNTFDPHGVTAYTSPSSGKPLGVLLNSGRTFLAVIDLNALLAAPRVAGTHTLSPGVNLVTSGIVRFVAVP